MDNESSISTGQILLRNRSDWPYWYAQLELHCRDKAVWDQINPAAETVAPIDDQEPIYPDEPTLSKFYTPLVVESTTTDEQKAADKQQKANATIELQEARLRYPEQVSRYKVEASKWTRKSAKLSNIRDWINKTVAASLMAPASIKLLNSKETTPQALVRILKDDLAPTDLNTMNLVRQQYRTHLDKARSGRMSPDQWFNKWQVIFGKAQAFKVTEVEGQLAVTNFLDAISVRLAPEWARSMRQHILIEAALGKPVLPINDIAKIFTLNLQEQAVSSTKGKGAAAFATFNGSPDQKSGSSNPNGNKCPCKPSNKHLWTPINCRRLQTAITGSAPSGAPKTNLSDLDKAKIKERYNSPEWTKLRDQVKEKGWGNAGSAGTGSNSSKYPGSISAAVIDPTQFGSSSGVYSAIYPAHPLSMSTILDGGGAVHLVNDERFLVPGTFKRARSTETIDAGTQSLPITGSGDRLIKSILHGSRGSKTEDLLLKDVKVVEGFHVNIVSEARLKKAGIWYLGLDNTLRYGSIKDNVIMAHLHCEHNLAFIEYNKIDTCSPSPTLVQANLRSSHPRTRTGDEDLWHKRSGHLGPRALQALVQAARNVHIDGTARVNCLDCATTHATQVISRRPRERSPRPFYRISWDLFDMPTGRLNEEWSMILKEDYSGKLYPNNIQAKSLDEIMRVIEKFEQRVSTKYGLKIVEIQQDNDTATRPWRGRSRYEEWADQKGIRIITPPPYTHEPNGSAERAGKELITKAIKMRTSANLPPKLWPEVIDAAAFLHGISPTAIHDYRSPNEVLDQWFQQYFRWYQPETIRHRTADLRPDWSGIYAYGCRSYPLEVDRAAGKNRRGYKVNPRAHIGYLVGYRASNIYLIWVPILDQVIITRNVTFDESKFYKSKDEEMPKEEAILIVDMLHDGELDDPGQDIQIPDLEIRTTAVQQTESIPDPNDGGEQSESTEAVIGLSRPQAIERAEAARDGSKASDYLDNRAGRLGNTGLATPEPTPDPIDHGEGVDGGVDLSDQMGTNNQQGVHSPVRADSIDSSDRLGSQGLRQERPTTRTSRSGRAASATPGEVEINTPPQRSSRRLRGEAPEIDRGRRYHVPLRRTRRTADQLGVVHKEV